MRLDELVEQLVDDSSIEAASHGCAVKYETREPVTVAGDPELLRRAVENVLRNAIRQSLISPGARMPSSRRLAEQLAISRNTVVRAYENLILEGHVEARPASGVFVAEEPPPLTEMVTRQSSLPATARP